MAINTEAMGSLPEYMKEPLSIWVKLALQQTSLYKQYHLWASPSPNLESSSQKLKIG
jgi:hypothetical protein